MPNTTVYIREKDWEKWKNTSNKAELISKALNDTESQGFSDVKKQDKFQELKSQYNTVTYEPME